MENNIIKILERLKVSFTNNDSRIHLEPQEFQNNLQIYNNNINDWSNFISFNGLKESKRLSRAYIDLDLYLTPASLHVDYSERDKKASTSELIKKINSNIIIIGQPGAGKTTSMKKIFKQFNDDPNSTFYPIAIKLREIKDYNYSIFKFLSKKLNFHIEALKTKPNDSELFSIKQKKTDSLFQEFVLYTNFFCQFFNQTKTLLIIDGYDEIPLDSKKNIDREIFELANGLKASKLIMTSRTSDYTTSLQNTKVFEICPLDEQQLRQFTIQWLADETIANNFLKQIKKSPYFDTAIRPLTLSHLCAIYERIGKIPDKPKTIHRKVVSLLIEEWDEQREIVRNSKYQNFEQDRKFEFLANLAFLLTTKFGKSFFSKEQVFTVYKAIHQNFDLPNNKFDEVLKEIETHTGIILCVGQQEYEFTHKSTQEYLTAEYLVRLPNIPDDIGLLIELPNELALAISLSSSPALYFISLIFERFYPIFKKFFDNNGLSCDAFRTKSISTKYDLSLHRINGFFNIFCNRLLIEKPDLPNSPLCTICILIINSLMLEYLPKTTPDNLLKKHCSLSLIKNYYEQFSHPGTDKVYFRKNEAIITTNYNLPSELVISQSQFQSLKKC